VINPGKIQHLLDTALELAVPVASMRLAMSGSINESYLVTLTDQREIFVKTHRRDRIAGMYAAEFNALKLLSRSRTLIVPKPLYQDEDFLVMEAFREGAPAADWQEQMGAAWRLCTTVPDNANMVLTWTVTWAPSNNPTSGTMTGSDSGAIGASIPS